MRITRRQIREALKDLQLMREDTIDTESDHLKKNVADDLDHIKDLKDDIEDDHDEEIRAEKEKAKHESRRRRRRGVRAESRNRRVPKVGYRQLRRIIREQNIEIHHHHGDQGYDDREDERLAAEHGGEGEHEQDYQDRRDDAGFEVRKEALKRRLRRIVRENTSRRRRRR